MEQPDRIFLRDHILATEIGAFQSERGRDQRLRFNVTLDLRQPVSGAEDHVDRVLSYDVLTQAVTTALADQRYNLVETLAERIAAEVLAHPRAACVAVSVEKLDRGPGALGVSITRHRGRVAATGAPVPVRLMVHGHGAPLPEGACIVVPGTAPDLPPGPHARRIALLDLDREAWVLAGLLDLEVAETRTELDAAIRSGSPVVWAPSRLAVDAPEAGQHPDMLALWLALRVGAHRVDFVRDAGAPLPAVPDGATLTLGRLP